VSLNYIVKYIVKHGGIVWVTLDPNPTQSVEEWTARAFDCIADAIDTEEMEVFHYHKAVIDTNHKLWHDTNSEFYHDFVYYFCRIRANGINLLLFSTAGRCRM
jgi:methanesulfonate monooxygenase large subunit